MIKRITMALTAALCLAACDKGEGVTPSTSEQVAGGQQGPVKGFFLLNEGNMGSNKATLDYFDYETGVYHRNIFAERNPGVARELGDVGNDLKIYGDRLYAVINRSNLVEVMDVNTARHIGAVTVPNCRYLAFDGAYAYVTSYAGAVNGDPHSRLGYVAKIDTATLQVVASCEVGYQPEQMAVAGGKLYVANSGGYRAPDYDRTVSVIDLASFVVVASIEVGINLHGMEKDRYGYLWVASRGDYNGNGSKTSVIDPGDGTVASVLHLLPNSVMAAAGDSMWVCSTVWSDVAGKNTVSYAIADIKSRTVLTRNFITDGTEKSIQKPYGLAVNPETGDVLVTDARDYLTPGTVYCFSRAGVKMWSAVTGDIPSRIAFTHKKLQF